MVLKNLIPFFKSDNSNNDSPPPNSPTTTIPPTTQIYQPPPTPENRQRDNDQIAALALSPRNQQTQRHFRSPSISIPTTNSNNQQQQPTSPTNTSPTTNNTRNRAISSPFSFTRKRGTSNVSNGSNNGSTSPRGINGGASSPRNSPQQPSSPRNLVREPTREERRKQLFKEFEMKKVVIYSNCKRLRALLDVLIERAKPHQVQNVSYVLAQMSVVETTGLPPTTENDLKVVKSELNSINLEIFRLSLLISESYKQEVLHLTGASTIHDTRSPTSIEDEQLFGNVSCESVILKIIGRELSDLERDLERMHRRCRGNKKKPIEQPIQPKRNNSLFGRRRGASAIERPSSMVLGNQDSKRRNSMEFYRSSIIDELGQSVMEKVIERVQNSQFRTVTKELHIEQGILMLIEKRYEEFVDKINRCDIDIYNPVRMSDLKSETFWTDFLTKKMAFTENEYQSALQSFLISKETENKNQEGSSSMENQLSNSNFQIENRSEEIDLSVQ
ncbi:hypothetical protein NAEGRDRAFT_81839 [Naegleria gruberi]|uniref:Uncharacterized protein n=1 Tax=Naegleria gruberi TaxID=5762 RepID=D2VZM0_NAEGR|nr:uncharacterized protein NAEGRDRAFT_81839 [Naegleria gruberi]EFC37682.1 hypothetical protein NAEGRDRAFT_81839 [Naegleria gruberi]|eukprot:XP_002670426.1 hypothetical protein NAEGRDRAFT_81839 [Naegleria gruberi strain NEG-M]